MPMDFLSILVDLVVVVVVEGASFNGIASNKSQRVVVSQLSQSCFQDHTGCMRESSQLFLASKSFNFI